MQSNFDPISYAIDVGRELVSSFAPAGQATTPGLVGSARETPTRRRLEHLLPRGIAVGSGCVIDSHGGTSKQMDVVLYERHMCPEYSINDDPATTYYPCEGVIAVGEIKSEMASRDLKDTFAKIASVKKLRRYARPTTDAIGGPYVSFRKYGSSTSFACTEEEQFDQDAKPFDQIFGFSLAGSVALQPETLCTKYAEMAALHEGSLSPNLIVTLDDNQVLCPLRMPANRHNPEIAISPQNANVIYCVNRPEGGFQFLLSRIYTVYRQGRTVEQVAFDRYFAKEGQLTLPSDGIVVSLT